MVPSFLFSFWRAPICVSVLIYRENMSRKKRSAPDEQEKERRSRTSRPSRSSVVNFIHQPPPHTYTAILFYCSLFLPLQRVCVAFQNLFFFSLTLSIFIKINKTKKNSSLHLHKICKYKFWFIYIQERAVVLFLFEPTRPKAGAHSTRRQDNWRRPQFAPDYVQLANAPLSPFFFKTHTNLKDKSVSNKLVEYSRILTLRPPPPPFFSFLPV